ncbi:MAG: hypothetical protein NPIRA06_09000 [Nitrospirales bacterium]|nr:MAG: hypothetical protein NPIRA06_09000 [Nitrospirales bacterium]
MASAHPGDNSGVILRMVPGMCAKVQKNKLTIVTSPALWNMGAWLERLVAESTRKEGKKERE